MERSTWRSPRGSLQFEFDWMSGEARGTLIIPDSEWRAAAMSAFRAVRGLLSPLLPASASGGRAADAVDYLVCHAFAPMTPVSLNPTLPIAGACITGARLADVLAVCHGATKPILVGPLMRELIWHPTPPTQTTIVGAGLTRVVLAFEAAMHGGMTLRRFRTSPEEATGSSATPLTDVFYLAYFVCELIQGREPYPTDDLLAYLSALRDGQADVPQDVPRELAAALSPDPGARPSLEALRDALNDRARRDSRKAPGN